MFAVVIVFGRIIAEQPQVKKIGGAGKKLEGRKIAFVERAGIGPNPADAALFQKSDDLRAMPTGVTKLNGESKIARQLGEKFAKRLPAVFGRERWRQLNKNDLQLRHERFDGAQKRIELRAAITEPANMSDFAGKFAAEPKRGRGHLHPALHSIFRRCAVKGRVDFNSREIARVKFQPLGLRQIRWIKSSSPIVETPGARADANLLLVGQIQAEVKLIQTERRCRC